MYGSILQGKNNVGGIIGATQKELYIGQNSIYSSNYVQVDLVSEDNNTVSLGIGNMPNQNKYLQDAYYYKYSTINGENPNEQNEIFISLDSYLTGEELKKQETYMSKLKWNTTDWNYSVLQTNKYPLINNTHLSGQIGIDLPIDEEHIVGNSLETQKIENIQKLEGIFEYDNKTIKTYNTCSVITSLDGTQVTRDAKLYVKDNNLYAIPIVLASTSDNEKNMKQY